MRQLNIVYNDTSNSSPSTCITFIHCASYGASHEGWERQAYGVRDQEFFKLKILAIRETKYELVG